jgi:menaquinone-dependent protoporphyrinogen oxidase
LTRVLVAYATRFGSTHEVASAIVHELNAAGLQAQSAEAGSALNPEGFDAFVIGSPMYGGKWMSEAAMFTAIMAERIGSKPVALFSMGTLRVNSPDTGHAEHAAFVERINSVASGLNVISDSDFTGYFERANLPWYLRIIDRFVPNTQGDHRDWNAIKSWARSLVPVFSGE